MKLNEMAAKQVCPKCGHGPISKTHRYVQGRGWKCLHPAIDPSSPPINPTWHTREQYYNLVDDLRQIEHLHRNAAGPLYLTDELIDRENVLVGDIEDDTPEFWNAMYNAAASAAGMRGEDYDININKLLGYVIY